MLSACCGALVVAAFGRVVLALFGSRRLMVVAAAVLAFLPHSLQYSREVRMYPLWMLALLVAMLGVAHAARAERPRAADLLAWWIGIAAAATTHHYTVLYVAALVPGTFVLTGGDWCRKEARDWRRLALLHVPIAMLAALEIAAALRFSGFTGAQLVAKVVHDLQFVGPRRPGRLLTALLVSPNWTAPPPGTLVDAFVAATVAASIGLTLSLRRLRRPAAFLAIVALVPIAIASVLPIRSYPRLFSPSVPCLVALLVAAAAAAVEARSRWRRVLIVPVSIAWLAILLPRVADVYRRDVEGWNAVCAAVAASEPEAGVLINEPYMRQAFLACYRGALPVHGVPARRVKLERRSILGFAEGKRVVWMIYSHALANRPAAARRDHARDRRRSVSTASRSTRRSTSTASCASPAPPPANARPRGDARRGCASSALRAQ